MRTPRPSLAIAVLSLGALAAALAITAIGADASQSARGASVLPGRIHPYPPGRWRLQSPAELSRVVLWGSPTVDLPRVEPHRRSLRTPVLANRSRPPPARTREQAAQLALRLAAEATKSPDDFARLAAESSEEIVTKDVAALASAGTRG